MAGDVIFAMSHLDRWQQQVLLPSLLCLLISAPRFTSFSILDHTEQSPRLLASIADELAKVGLEQQQAG